MTEQALERLVLTARAQRAADEDAADRGVASAELMESAGRAAAEWILDRLRPSRVAILFWIIGSSNSPSGCRPATDYLASRKNIF